MQYRFFGLDFRVDSPLPGFAPTSSLPRASGSVAVSLRVAASDPADNAAWRNRYRAPIDGTGERPGIVIDESTLDARLRIRYADGTTFVLDRAGSDIRASWTAQSVLQDVCIYLLGPVCGLLLYLRGLTCLHASAIVHRGRALVFVGAAEAGKSTLAAAFACRGHRVLTDDILVLEEHADAVMAQPGLPRIGLWPPSVEQLWGDADALPLQVPNWEKRYLDLGREGLFQDTALPIGGVYVLSDREPDAMFAIEPLPGAEAVFALIANKYVTRIAEREQDQRDFVLLSSLAASVPIRRIRRSDALSDLNATCEAILADYDALALSPA